MTEIRWDLPKSQQLKMDRGVSFEEIIQAEFIGIQEHPARGNQNLLLFELHGYIWVVPYVVNGDDIFLKTIFPSRKYTRMWKRGELK